MRKQLTFEEKLEQKLYCFGGGGGGGGGGSTNPGRPGGESGERGSPNSTGSGGNTYNFNQVSKADQARGMNYEKVLDNGVVVQDFSTPFGGMANAQPQTSSQPSGAFGQLGAGLYDNLAVNMPNVPTGQTVSRPDLGAVAGALDNINAVTPQQAMQQALAPGQIGDGRIGLGGGFSAGKVPGGFGVQFDTVFAKGGVVENQGIASLMKRR